MTCHKATPLHTATDRENTQLLQLHVSDIIDPSFLPGLCQKSLMNTSQSFPSPFLCHFHVITVEKKVKRPKSFDKTERVHLFFLDPLFQLSTDPFLFVLLALKRRRGTRFFGVIVLIYLNPLASRN